MPVFNSRKAFTGGPYGSIGVRFFRGYTALPGTANKPGTIGLFVSCGAKRRGDNALGNPCQYEDANTFTDEQRRLGGGRLYTITVACKKRVQPI